MDDDDDDADWPEEIEFGDGTKVSVTQHSATASALASEKPSSVEGGVFVTEADTAAPASNIKSPPKAADNPWKASIADHTLLEKIVPSQEFPAISVAAQRSTANSTSNVQNDSRANITGVRSGSHREEVYAYTENDYDRRWSHDPPAVREIFNSTTGQFEKVAETSRNKWSKRSTSFDKKNGPNSSQGPEVLQRNFKEHRDQDRPSRTDHTSRRSGSFAHQDRTDVSLYSSQDARAMHSQNQDAIAARRGQLLHDGIVGASVVSDHSTTVASKAEPEKVEPVNPEQEKAATMDAEVTLDPSSDEFIEAQKRLMAESRANAIQRRKDQEAEETARRERTRKKAEELAKLSEKSKPKLVTQEAKSAKEKKAKAPEQKHGANERKIVKGTITETVLRQPEFPDTTTKGNQRSSRNIITNLTSVSNGQTQKSAEVEAPEQIIFQEVGLKEPLSPTDDSLWSKSGGEASIADRLSQDGVWGPIGSKNGSPVASSRDGSRFDAKLRDGSVTHPFSLSAGLSYTNAQSNHPPERRSAKGQWNAFAPVGKEQEVNPSFRNSPHDEPSPALWRRPSTESFPRNVNLSSPDQTGFEDSKEKSVARMTEQTSPKGGQSRSTSRFFPSNAHSVIQAHITSSRNTRVSKPVPPPTPPRISSPSHSLYSEPTNPVLALPLDHPPAPMKRTSTRNIDQVMSNIKGAMQELRPYKVGFLSVGTRSIWEIKLPALPPRVKLSKIPRTLDWKREAIAEEASTKPINDSAGVNAVEPSPVAEITTQKLHPRVLTPAWVLPLELEIASRTNLPDPLIDPLPSIILPNTEAISHEPRPKVVSESQKIHKPNIPLYATTRKTLKESPDHINPIRIKLVGLDAVSIPRKYGRRLEFTDRSNNGKSPSVSRTPVNPADIGAGRGFAQGRGRGRG